MKIPKKLELKTPLERELDKAFNSAKEKYYKENPNGSFDRDIFDNLQEFVTLRKSVVEQNNNIFNIYNIDTWNESFESISQTATSKPAGDEIIYGIFELLNAVYFRVRVNSENITFSIQVYESNHITKIPINQPYEIKKIFNIYQDLFWNLTDILNNKTISDRVHVVDKNNIDILVDEYKVDRLDLIKELRYSYINKLFTSLVSQDNEYVIKIYNGDDIYICNNQYQELRSLKLTDELLTQILKVEYEQ